jgi:hypothetical protein
MAVAGTQWLLLAPNGLQAPKNVATLMQLQSKWALYQLGKVARSAQGSLTTASRVVSADRQHVNCASCQQVPGHVAHADQCIMHAPSSCPLLASHVCIAL